MAISLSTKCDLCPRACGVDRDTGQKGICGAADELRVARAALHFWEEPVISVGAGSGAVFFSNCPLHCIYCQNADIAQGRHGIDISVERLSDIFLELQAQGAANINLVTATHYMPQVKHALSDARRRGLHLPIISNTSGYETPKAIDHLSGYVDIFLSDFKYWKDGPAPVGAHDVSLGSNAARLYSHAPDYFDVATRALDHMIECVEDPAYDMFAHKKRLVKGVVVRHLILPGRVKESEQIMRFLWGRYHNHVLYSVMNQYTPMKKFPETPELSRRVTKDEYEELLDYMDSLGMEDYFWQQGGTAKESFIPSFDCTGVLPNDT